MHDHSALAYALEPSKNTSAQGQQPGVSPSRVVPVFVFDRGILDALPSRDDRRVAFIVESLEEIHQSLQQLGSGLVVAEGDPVDLIPSLAERFAAGQVVCARDYEPSAIERDRKVGERLKALGKSLVEVKDQAVFDRNEVLSATSKPYTVFTPYRNAWIKRLEGFDTRALDSVASTPSSERLVQRDDLEQILSAALNGVSPQDEHRRGQGGTRGEATHHQAAFPLGAGRVWIGPPDLEALGFAPVDLAALGINGGASQGEALLQDFMARIGRYKELRDFPGKKGVSYLSVHLRFGTVSIRRLAREAWQLFKGDDPSMHEGAFGWLSELIWRDFYMQILWQRPDVVANSFKPEFDRIQWEEGPTAIERFEAWKNGMTGYPFVDAAQRQLNTTGYMHNRLRMVSASFLTKHLGIDWRWGESYFAWKLNDFDLSANNGGWQWAASTGCDAQPYFRIFNPVTQSERFDPSGRFIRRYVPEIAQLPDEWIHQPWLAPAGVQSQSGCKIGRDYPSPIVDHATARQNALDRFDRILKPQVTS